MSDTQGRLDVVVMDGLAEAMRSSGHRAWHAGRLWGSREDVDGVGVESKQVHRAGGGR